MTVNSDPAAVAPVTARGRGGPPLPAPIAAYAVLTLATAATFPGPWPDDGAAAALATVQAHPVQATVWALLLVGSAVPLAVWTAAVCHRLQALGARVAGPLIGLVGGVLAALCLLLSGLVGWTAIPSAPLGDAGRGTRGFGHPGRSGSGSPSTRPAG